MSSVRKLRLAGFVAAAAMSPNFSSAEPVAVLYSEGSLHGFLALRAPDGKVLADGDAFQTVRGDEVTAHVVFHFKDGSLHDETTIYSQRQRFKLVSYRLVQKGPAFPQPLEMTIDGGNGKVGVRYHDEQGRQQSADEHFDVPSDLANGMIPTLLKNLQPGAQPKSLSYIAATPQPRLVKLAVSRVGGDAFSLAGSRREAAHYVLKVEIGGIAGLLAPLAGKQPPDSHIWILDGEVPAFIRADQPFYTGSPLWQIELATPTLPRTPVEVASTRNNR